MLYQAISQISPNNFIEVVLTMCLTILDKPLRYFLLLYTLLLTRFGQTTFGDDYYYLKYSLVYDGVVRILYSTKGFYNWERLAFLLRLQAPLHGVFFSYALVSYLDSTVIFGQRKISIKHDLRFLYFLSLHVTSARFFFFIMKETFTGRRIFNFPLLTKQKLRKIFNFILRITMGAAYVIAGISLIVVCYEFDSALVRYCFISAQIYSLAGVYISKISEAWMDNQEITELIQEFPHQLFAPPTSFVGESLKLPLNREIRQN